MCCSVVDLFDGYNPVSLLLLAAVGQATSSLPEGDDTYLDEPVVSESGGPLGAPGSEVSVRRESRRF